MKYASTSLIQVQLISIKMGGPSYLEKYLFQGIVTILPWGLLPDPTFHSFRFSINGDQRIFRISEALIAWFRGSNRDEKKNYLYICGYFERQKNGWSTDLGFGESRLFMSCPLGVTNSS